MANEKYRVHEVAKDFNLPTKTITEILTKYVAAPKNHMQVLTDSELSLIFDSLTQTHPVSGIQAIFADTYAEKKPEPVVEIKPEVKEEPVILAKAEPNYETWYNDAKSTAGIDVSYDDEGNAITE